MADEVVVVKENQVTEIVLWDRLTREPIQWFLRFQRYYLLAGLARSVRSAYRMFIRENYPSNAEEILARRMYYNNWLAIAKKWMWVERASAWDVHRNSELKTHVSEASRYLQEHSLDAATALVAALDNQRLVVAAANAILDRVGLPTLTRQEILNATINLSADDMKAISEEVEKWKQSTYGENG